MGKRTADRPAVKAGAEHEQKREREQVRDSEREGTHALPVRLLRVRLEAVVGRHGLRRAAPRVEQEQQCKHMV
jgi:hypothetical protein